MESKVTFRPLHDRLLVRRSEREEKSRGGLYLPETAKEKPLEAEIVAVGTGRRMADGTLRDPQVKAGDRVLFGKYSGDEVKLNGEDFLILREDDVLAVLS